VHARISQLQARTAEVETEAERRAASARRHKEVRIAARGTLLAGDVPYRRFDALLLPSFRALQEVRRLRAELLQAQAAQAGQRATADAMERRVAAALSAQRSEAEKAARHAAAALAAQRAETEAALQRAAAAERARCAQLHSTERQPSASIR
jgi:hypothetical protein